jgi:hypothetical protein
MKDIETIIPFLREFLNERGLKDVKIELRLLDVPIDVIRATYIAQDLNNTNLGYVKQTYKTVKHENDSITLESKYF